MIVEAYQTLEDKDNIDHIEMEGPFVCRRSGAWLGIGYYFWDTNMDWAIAWGENSYNNYNKDFIVAKCKLDLTNNCFDLVGNVKHQMELMQSMDVMLKSNKIKKDDEKILPYILIFMKRMGLFNFKSIRASDMHKNILKLHFKPGKGEYMIINQRVQICVIEKKEVLLRPFSVIYPEKYLY